MTSSLIRIAEVRQALDLEHWVAFQPSFRRLTQLTASPVRNRLGPWRLRARSVKLTDMHAVGRRSPGRGRRH